MAVPSVSRTILSRLLAYPGHLRNYVIWKWGFCRNLRKHPPVFVYQMGKVGSQSITNELERVYRGEVIHCHRFDAHYHHGKVQELWRYWHEPGPHPAMHIVSPFRNPVDRNISAFFHNFRDYFDMPPEKCPLPMEELLRVFLEKFPHQHALDWYEHHMGGFFGIDVYARPFPDRGWDVFEKGDLRLLVLRLEMPQDEMISAIRAYLGLSDFNLRRDNVATEKSYAPLYRQFKDEVRLPDDYLDRMLGSKYFKHFYSDHDAAVTRAKWGAAD